MALKDIWSDKSDGIDDVLAKDINDLAHGIIELENVSDNIAVALDRIIEIQNSLMGEGA